MALQFASTSRCIAVFLPWIQAWDASQLENMSEPGKSQEYSKGKHAGVWNLQKCNYNTPPLQPNQRWLCIHELNFLKPNLWSVSFKHIFMHRKLRQKVFHSQHFHNKLCLWYSSMPCQIQISFKIYCRILHYFPMSVSQSVCMSQAWHLSFSPLCKVLDHTNHIFSER